MKSLICSKYLLSQFIACTPTDDLLQYKKLSKNKIMFKYMLQIKIHYIYIRVNVFIQRFNLLNRVNKTLILLINIQHVGSTGGKYAQHLHTYFGMKSLIKPSS